LWGRNQGRTKKERILLDSSVCKSGLEKPDFWRGSLPRNGLKKHKKRNHGKKRKKKWKGITPTTTPGRN